MKAVKFGIYGVIAGAGVLMTGCQTPVIVDYVRPAREVKDVSLVDVISISAKTNVKGDYAGDQTLNAGLVKQLLAERLYDGKFYRVSDDVWSDAAGAGAMSKLIADKGSNHGYSGIVAKGQGDAKVGIDLDLDLELNVVPVNKDMEFTLATTPYTVKPGKKGAPSTSLPDGKNMVIAKKVESVTVYETVAKGVLKAKFVGVNGKECPMAYAKEIEVKIPEADRFDSAKPTQLKALAAAVTPAIVEVIKDISPYKEQLEIKPVEGGDKRVLTLLRAMAFSEVVDFVTELKLSRKAVSADIENLGLAYEAMGRLYAAKDEYAEAIKINPESKTAPAALKRVEAALASEQAVEDSNAEKNEETTFDK